MVDWVKMSQEAVAEAGLEGEVVYFNRAGYNGSQGAHFLARRPNGYLGCL